MEETAYWVAFGRLPRLGSTAFERLERHFGLLERAWEASGGELRAAGLDDKSIEVIVEGRVPISPEAELDRLVRLGIDALTWNDPRYPARLRQISLRDRPPLLYLRGSLEEADSYAVGVVGTRRATAYGRQATETIVSELAHFQISIVSGLARGIDTAAHQAALAAGGRTIAVLPCAIDRVYPVQNTRLAQAIREQGALLSDYPPGTPTQKEFFFRRNRIIAGLSLGVVVVEAGESSGAGWTAKTALEENREVFAVPGNIFSPYSRGTNALIQGNVAKLVSSGRDIVDELNLSMVSEHVEVQRQLPMDETEQALLDCVGAEPTHIDEIGRRMRLAPGAVAGALSVLEMKGLVQSVGGANFVRLHPA